MGPERTSGSFCKKGVDSPGCCGFVKIVEGCAGVLMAPAKGMDDSITNTPFGDDGLAAQCGDGEDQSVFFNKAQVVNRDLSVCVLQAFVNERNVEPKRRGGTDGHGVTVLEALSATGLRAARYWHEVTGLRKVVANDMDPDAVDSIRRNMEFNGVPIISVEASNADAEGIVDSQKKAREQRGAENPDDSARALRENHRSAVAGVIPNIGNAISVMQRLGHDPFADDKVVAIDKKSGRMIPLLQQEKYDVVDLDPYGTAAPFLDAAMQCIKEGGLLMVTCTDSAILCGSYSETCHAKYASLSVRADHCHESAARIVVGAIERTANRHSKYCVPLLSLHIDFYVRVFVRVFTQPAEAKRSVSRMAHVLQCNKCPAFRCIPVGNARAPKAHRKRERDQTSSASETPQPRVIFHPAPSRDASMSVTPSPLPDHSTCDVCGGKFCIAGPIYGGPVHDPEFLGRVLNIVDERASQGQLTAAPRVRGLVCAAADELPDTPLFYRIDHIASTLKMRVPRAPLYVGALRRLGYRCSQVHCIGVGLKTDAPAAVIFGVMRAYREQSSDETKSDIPEFVLCPVVHGCDFTYDQKYDLSSGATGIVKFVPNAPRWGPLARHKGAKKEAE